jgi:hypothetical protein
MKTSHEDELVFSTTVEVEKPALTPTFGIPTFTEKENPVETLVAPAKRLSDVRK